MNRISFATVLGALLLSGCTGQQAANLPHSGGPRVLAVETFLADMAQNVAGDRVSVGVLLPAGIDPHEYQLKPQDAIQVSQSDVVILNGLGYETWLSKSLASSSPEQLAITASDGLSATAGDPHLWMSPRNAVRYVENIRDGLTQADPGGGEIYARNADAYIGRLNDLDAWIVDQVAQVPAERRLLVTNHEALQPFADAYGFRVLGAIIPSVSSESAPSARQIADLVQTIQEHAAPAVFVDISENPDIARQIGGETGAKVVTGLYVETLSAPDGPAPTYIDMLKYDVSLIVEALR